MEEQRPEHLVIDCSRSVEPVRIPLSDAEWEQQKADVRAAQEEIAAREQREADLRETVQNHSDPVVQELARRAGIIQ